MSNQPVRMYSKDVLALKDTIPTDLYDRINQFIEDNHKDETACNTLLQVLDCAADPPEDLKLYDIDVEGTFEYSEGIIELLCEKVRELILMMRNADNDKYHPLSMGSIDNVGTSLFRRIFFIANEKEIRERANGEIVYPFIVVNPELNRIMRDVFLSIYFSDVCDKLVPMYVYAALPFCMRSANVKFNVQYPIKNIRVPELENTILHRRVRELRHKNPPNSTPYVYRK